MDNDDLMIGLSVIVVAALMTYLGFWGGRKFEERYWHEAIPAQMNQLCLDCANIGKEGLR